MRSQSNGDVGIPMTLLVIQQLLGRRLRKQIAVALIPSDSKNVGLGCVSDWAPGFGSVPSQC